MAELSPLQRVKYSIAAAEARLGRSVVSVNPDALPAAQAALAGGQQPTLVGVKNTSGIPVELARRLLTAPGNVWLTRDRMAPGGRAIDTGLVNPLTGRPMTGSTSGGAVNVLECVTDLAVGTDGGGSVLGPAMTCNLWGVIGTGLGLTGQGQGRSTDNIMFTSGIGLIARSLSTLARGLDQLLGRDCWQPLLGAPRAALAGLKRIVVPAASSVTRPDGLDMRTLLAPALAALAFTGAAVVELDFSGTEVRAHSLELLRAILADPECLILTAEGPVDVYGSGDSVLGSFGGPEAAAQLRSGKYLLRSANMAGATAVVVPGGRVSSGFLVTAPPGEEPGRRALAAAALLADVWPAPELFHRYFSPDKLLGPGFPQTLD
ncbi:MAG: amidase family protein [Chloroflexota bacterium]